LSTPHAEHLYSATSIVPGGEPSVYLVIDNLGRLGSVWREVDVEATDYETVIRDLLSGQYSDPVRIVSFNTGEGWSPRCVGRDSRRPAAAMPAREQRNFRTA
jgi:hypothetical protein